MDGPLTTNGYEPDQFRKVLVGRRDVVHARLRTLLVERGRIEEEIAKLEAEMGHLNALLSADEGSATGLTPSVPAPQQEPAELVVRLLTELGRPMHYREIEQELRTRGWYYASGSDPANTLLARYFADPRLYRPRRGTYALRDESTREIRSVGKRSTGDKDDE